MYLNNENISFINFSKYSFFQSNSILNDDNTDINDKVKIWNEKFFNIICYDGKIITKAHVCLAKIWLT